MALFAAILAGGSGTRLWPLSTKATPKQFLPLTGERTMIQATVDRLGALTTPEQTYIVTFADYVPLVREQLPQVPPANIIAEPQGRGTAASIGLAAIHIAARDPQGVMGVFSADHLIADIAGFQRALVFAEQLAREGHLVTLGIQPTAPETGFGYIQAGADLARSPDGLVAYAARRFVEKPDRERAIAFMESGEYAWNAGIFIWRADRILDEIRRYVPAVGGVLDEIAVGLAQGRADEAMRAAWPRLTANVTIDFGVLEKAGDIAMIPVSIGWSDIGSWSQIAALHGDTLVERPGMPARHIAVGTRDTFVYSTTGRTIATAGVRDLIVVDTGDALLICHRDATQLVRQIADQL
jgi:mannose-1-phosphate guanylyltransferase